VFHGNSGEYFTWNPMEIPWSFPIFFWRGMKIPCGISHAVSWIIRLGPICRENLWSIFQGIPWSPHGVFICFCLLGMKISWSILRGVSVENFVFYHGIPWGIKSGPLFCRIAPNRWLQLNWSKTKFQSTDDSFPWALLCPWLKTNFKLTSLLRSSMISITLGPVSITSGNILQLRATLWPP